jgi:hypothetical protein
MTANQHRHAEEDIRGFSSKSLENVNGQQQQKDPLPMRLIF